MIKVALVDDEMLVRIGMKSVIPWQEFGFILVGEASSGEEALELCRKMEPDILLVDIVMPGISGIELIRRVKHLYPSTACIILTCLDEMDYVKEAMAIGAAGYFTKITIDQVRMLELLMQLKLEIESRKQKDNELLTLRHYIDKHRWLIRERQFQDWLSNQRGETYAAQQELPDTMQQMQDADQLIVIRMSKARIDNRRLLKESIFNLLEDIVQHLPMAIGIFPSGDLEFAMLCRTSHVELADSKLRSLKQEISESLRMYFNMEQVEIQAEAMSSLSDLADAYARLMNSQTETAISPHALETQQISVFEESYERIETSMMDAIRDGNQSAALRAVEELLNSMQAAHLDLERMRRYALQCMFALEKVCRQFGESVDDYFAYDQIDRMIRCESQEQLGVCLIDDCAVIIGRLMQALDNSSRSEIARVVEFIRKHYQERLTLEYVSSIANMNRTYFSRLFKKEMGVGFVDYVTQYRIERAKDLLRNKDLRVHEIAELTGFVDENYFSKVFKRYTGISPTAFRTIRG